MPLILDEKVIRDKNALHGGHPFLLLLEIAAPGVSDLLRVAMNTEDVVWRGETWQAVTFELEEISQGGGGEVPQVELRIANPDRMIEPYIEMYDLWVKKNGFEPIVVHIIVVNTVDLASGKAVVDHEYELISPKTSDKWVSFTLGASNPFNSRFPKDRLLKDHCRFKFKDRRCKYQGPAASCGHTLAACRKLGNSHRFGGFPGIGKPGIYLAEL